MSKLCSECVNAAFSRHGVYCMALHVDIWDEKVAEECGLFELPAGDSDTFINTGTTPFDQDAQP
jgi:hypothetical protein